MDRIPRELVLGTSTGLRLKNLLKREYAVQTQRDYVAQLLQTMAAFHRV